VDRRVTLLPLVSFPSELSLQVLVWDDVLGTWSGHQAKFVRRFADVRSEREKGVRDYVEAVRKGVFPGVDTESYSMDPGEWEKLLEGEREAGNLDHK
jgi:3-methyl-2-oxobutanoate hydroxymethyltransferase